MVNRKLYCSRFAIRDLRFVCLLAATWFAITAVAQVAVPPLESRVTDLTRTLTPEQKHTLESRLQDFEREKGAQLAVLIVPTIKPESIEQYGLRVAEAWKLGRKGVDDGALLLVAKDDRELRIETGYGLEGVLPDAVANRIIEDIIVPRFRDGDFYGGIEAGVAQMIGVISGEPLPAPRARRDDNFTTGAVLPIIVFALIAGQILSLFLGRLGGGVITSASAGLLVWIFLSSIVFAVIVAVFVFMLQLFGGVPSRSYGRRGGWHHDTGGWSSGGGSWGGFSGGGGSFGGGGASGRW